MPLSSIRETLATTPRQAFLAGVTIGLTQLAACSFFRNSSRMISLMGRVQQVPGGRALFFSIPAVLAVLCTRCWLKPSNNYVSVHARVDADIKADTAQEGRARPQSYKLDPTCEAYILPNYPKSNPLICNFDGAFGFAKVGEKIRVIAVAGGYELSPESQRITRETVDCFFENYKRDPGDFTVNVNDIWSIFDKTHTQMEEKYNSNDPNKGYGGASFAVGRMVENNSRFAGVMYGNCMGYHLQLNSQWQEINLGKSGVRKYSIPVQAGDKILFATDAVHRNLPKDDYDNLKNLKKLVTAYPDANPGGAIMNHILEHTKDLLEALEKGADMDDSTNGSLPDRLGSAVLMVFTI